MTCSLDFRARSELGLVRTSNQDSGYASQTLLLVADGMGGAAAGDIAGAVAVLTARELDEQVKGVEQMHERLAEMVNTANDRLHSLTEAEPSLDGMGTTFCGVMFDGTHAALAHIGDSRCYLLRGGALTQITHDHSWVQQLIDENRLSPEQAATHPHRSLLLKVLNGQSNYVPDYDKLAIEPGDRLLLCSDGLSGMIDDATIGTSLAKPDLDEAADSLIAAALAGGGHDNITVVIAEALPTTAAPAATSLTVGAAQDLEIRAAELAETGEAAEEAEEAGSEPTGTPTRRYWRRGLALGLLAALILALGGWGAVGYAQSRYFLAAADGKVGIYNGLPGAVFGYSLHTLVEQRDTPISDLPVHYQNVVGNTIGSPSLAAAQETADILDELAKRCRQTRQQRADQAAATPSTTSKATSYSGPVGYPTYLGTMAPSGVEDSDPEFC